MHLVQNYPPATRRAGQAIGHYFSILEAEPEIGRPIDDIPALRELVIPFGDSGYVALYRYDKTTDTVYVLAVRHQKEAGY